MYGDSGQYQVMRCAFILRRCGKPLPVCVYVMLFLCNAKQAIACHEVLEVLSCLPYYIHCHVCVSLINQCWCCIGIAAHLDLPLPIVMGKKGARGGGRSGAGAAAAAVAAPAVDGSGNAAAAAGGSGLMQPSVNAAHFAEIKRMVHDLVTNCDAFTEAQAANPLTFAEGSRETPYSDELYTQAMGNAGEYKCGCNLFWLDFDEVDGPGRDVPLSMKQINGLMTHYFQSPRAFPKDVVVDARPETLPSSIKNKLVRVSPPEIIHALVMAIYRDFQDGVADDVMQGWRKCVLSCPMVFKNLDSEDDKHWRLLQERQNSVADAAGMKHTPLQMIADIVAYRKRKSAGNSNMSAADVAEAYKKNVNWAGDAEDKPISFSFVDSCLTVHDRLLSIPAVRSLLYDCQEADMPNPFDKIGKLQAVVSKAQTEECITWSMEMLADLYKSGALSLEQMGQRALEGRTAAQAGKGTVDLLCYKLKAKRFFTSEWLDSLSLTPEVKDTIRGMMVSIAKFREMAGYSYNQSFKKVNLAWRAGWPRSAELAVELIEVSAVHLYNDDKTWVQTWISLQA